MNYVLREVKFSFRQPSAKVVAEAKKAGIPAPIKRDPVTLQVPQITFEGLEEIIKSDDSKVKEFILGAINSTLIDYVQQKLNEQPRHLQIDVSKVDLSDVSLETLANMPQDERKSRGISEELWDLFEQDYRQIMPAAAGLDEIKITNHVKAFRNRFNALKTNKKVIKKLAENLEIWARNTDKLEELQQIYAVLSEKAENLLNSNDDEEMY